MQSKSSRLTRRRVRDRNPQRSRSRHAEQRQVTNIPEWCRTPHFMAFPLDDGGAVIQSDPRHAVSV